MRPTICRYCPAPLPPPPARRKRGAPRTVCEACTQVRRKLNTMKCHARREERRHGTRPPSHRTPLSRAMGPGVPLDAAGEARELAAREARFRAAVAEGLARDALLERFPDTLDLLRRLGLRVAQHGGYPAGLPV